MLLRFHKTISRSYSSIFIIQEIRVLRICSHFDYIFVSWGITGCSSTSKIVQLLCRVNESGTQNLRKWCALCIIDFCYEFCTPYYRHSYSLYWKCCLSLGLCCYLRNRRWGGCVYVLQMFFVFCFLLFVFSVCHESTRQPFLGTAERIFMKLLPNDCGENRICIAVPKWGLGPRLIFLRLKTTHCALGGDAWRVTEN